MYKRVCYTLSICLFILSGCMNSGLGKNEDVAAIVRGEEITVGYLRLLYPDDAIKEIIDEVVKAKLAKQEVQKMRIDISEVVKDIEESYGEYPGDELDSAEALSIRTFAKPQAEKIGMTPKEYYRSYTKASAEMSAYVNAYTSEILGGIQDDEFGIEEYVYHANELLDHLMELNKDMIEIHIK